MPIPAGIVVGGAPSPAARVLERVLGAYHRGGRHGGAAAVTASILDELLAERTAKAFADADPMPADADVLRALDGAELDVLGEGYHVMALSEPQHGIVIKYAKSAVGLPPMAPPDDSADPHGWGYDHGVDGQGRLQEVIWQHVRAFESYGCLTVPSRVYLSEHVLGLLDPEERATVEHFRTLGIVRPIAGGGVRVRPRYPAGFPDWKRAPRGTVAVSVLVAQPMVTPVADAMHRDVLAGDPAHARRWQERYRTFVQQLWAHGISHLDFSVLNVGVTGPRSRERLVLFDPHMGAIELSPTAVEVADPMAEGPEDERSMKELLRAARDGSRWALWHVQELTAAEPDVPPERISEAADIVRDFHVETDDLERGDGTFSLERFQSSWHRRGVWHINDVARAQLDELAQHPLAQFLGALVGDAAGEEIYDRRLCVRGADGAQLAQFRARLQVYQRRPLVLVTNLAEHEPGLTKQWGHLQLPAELDIQDDPAIHYHLRDLLTGEIYIRAGADLARDGLSVGLAPFELHALQIEDIRVHDLVVERALAGGPDLSDLFRLCTKTLAAVGDIHGDEGALKEILRALGFIDATDSWFAGPATLVLTGDVGHGPRLQATFDFVRSLAKQAHAAGGRIVWTLGNHDLFADVEGGQGGMDSMGFQLWPQVRRIALRPETAPGLTIAAAHEAHGKIFVHGGVLPDIAAMAPPAGRADPTQVVDFINDVFTAAIAARDRLHAKDQPHEIFRIGTSHARDRRLPGERGYEPAGVFTPDLRELDHYRYHGRLLPQVVGHTACRKGRIRYSPGSRMRRDYIAIDVGRQHGLGNGGLFLTDLGWMAVEPDARTRLVEISPLFAELAHRAARTADPSWSEPEWQAHVIATAAEHLRAEPSAKRTSDARREDLYLNLPPAQADALDSFFGSIRATGQCVLVTDLAEELTAAFGRDPQGVATQVLAHYLAAGGCLIVQSAGTFDWLYARVLRPLLAELGMARRHLLANMPLILAGGSEIHVYRDGGYRLVSQHQAQREVSGLDHLAGLSPRPGAPPWGDLDGIELMYLADSSGPAEVDEGLSARSAVVVDMGEAVGTVPAHHVTVVGGYRRAVDLLALAAKALQDSGRARSPLSDDPPETTLWTFGDKVPDAAGRRVRVRVAASGFLHAGVAGTHGGWESIVNVPLVPLAHGGYETLLPAEVNAFTFFWTEPPTANGRPGHWEREQHGGRVFAICQASSGRRDGVATAPSAEPAGSS